MHGVAPLSRATTTALPSPPCAPQLCADTEEGAIHVPVWAVRLDPHDTAGEALGGGAGLVGGGA